MKRALRTSWPYALLMAGILWFLYAGLGCGTVPPTPTPTSYTCETYCAHAVSMGCDFAKDTGAGGGCVAVCQNVQDKLVRWDLACRSTAPTCPAINACER